MENLIISTSPHIRSKESVHRIMWSVTLALLPAGIAGVWIFGIRALWVLLTTTLTAVASEAAFQKLRKKDITVQNGSAFLAGLLLGYNLPANIPLWQAALGSVFAIVIVKQLFGGLGHNIFNPALAGRAFLQIAYPARMSSWPVPFGTDAVTGATALDIKKNLVEGTMPTNLELLIGNRGGCIGEVCIIALIVGGLFLLIMRYIHWRTPVSFIGTVALLSWAFGGEKFFSGDVIFYVLAGGLMLGAIFMATDPVTSPITKKGRWIFGCGCGLITTVIRLWGGYPEGVCYSILLMNAAVPLIDRFTKPRVYGKIK
jgi:electron transport complex protein RnfD